jgi:hypothetical protein
VRHLVRIDQTSVAKNFYINPKGRRKNGKPRLRLSKDAENNLRELKMKVWSEDINSREE